MQANTGASWCLCPSEQGAKEGGLRWGYAGRVALARRQRLPV